MREITLDCALLREPRAAQEHIRNALSLPDWYGRNLDALHDALTELTDAVIILDNAQVLEEPSPYPRSVLRVLWDAQRENPTLHVILFPADTPAE